MTPREYLQATPTMDDDGYIRDQWTLMRAYVRMSRSGTIQLDRFSPNRTKQDRNWKNRTNHENDRWLINEMAEAGLLRVHYSPTSIDLFPSEDGVDWLAVMDGMDDPNKPDPRYAELPLYGQL